MWNNARLLNGLADLLFLVAAGVAVWIAGQAALRTPLLPLREVVVVGELEHVDARAASASLAGRVAGNFFSVELDEVRRSLERLPWVRSVAVRREWPDRIVARIEEHTALARWSDHRLVNTFGELFEGEGADARLAELVGPPGSEREVARRYRAFREVVAPLGTQPVRVALSARGAWQVRLANGLVLELGRDQARQSLEERLARFVAAYPRVAGELDRPVGHVDLRYPNGFAIRVPQAGTDDGAQPSRKRT